MNILVRNLSKAVTEKDLLHMFLPFGMVKSLNIVIDTATRASKGFGFVDMPDDGEAAAAIKALDGKPVRGQKIRVKKTVKQSHAPAQDRPDKVQAESFEGRETRKPSKGKDSAPRGAKGQRTPRKDKRGFGFVTMPKDAAAAAAAASIKGPDGTPMRGEKIRVKKTVKQSRPSTQYRTDKVQTERFEGRETRKPVKGKSSGPRGAKSQRPARRDRH